MELRCPHHYDILTLPKYICLDTCFHCTHAYLVSMVYANPIVLMDARIRRQGHQSAS